MPRPILPDCPAFLNAAARAIRAELIAELDYMGRLTRVDESVLSEFCSAYEEAQRLTRFLQRRGLTYTMKGSGYVAMRPQIAIRRTAWERGAGGRQDRHRRRLAQPAGRAQVGPLGTLATRAGAEHDAPRERRRGVGAEGHRRGDVADDVSAFLTVLAVAFALGTVALYALLLVLIARASRPPGREDEEPPGIW
jgi:P27 family predicted phage terminase small subunit